MPYSMQNTDNMVRYVIKFWLCLCLCLGLGVCMSTATVIDSTSRAGSRSRSRATFLGHCSCHERVSVERTTSSSSAQSRCLDHVTFHVVCTSTRPMENSDQSDRLTPYKSTPNLKASLCSEVLKCLSDGSHIENYVKFNSCESDFLVFVHLPSPMNVNSSQPTILKFVENQSYVTFLCKCESCHSRCLPDIPISNSVTRSTSRSITCNIFPLDFRINLFKSRRRRPLHLHIRCFLKKKSARFKRSSESLDADMNEKSVETSSSMLRPAKREEPVTMKDGSVPPSQGKSYPTTASHLLFTKFNETAYKLLLDQEEMKRIIRRESEWAYLCVVFIILLILFAIYILRGFHSRTANQREIRHDDTHHYLSVKEVLYRKARYLPMFNGRLAEFEEVFVHDCGTNP